MNSVIEYGGSKASASDIELHLKKCDAFFIPKLSARVNIEAYSKKIADKAMCFEAWSIDVLVGVIAVYYSPAKPDSAYITNVSVLPEFQRRGIAFALLDNLLSILRRSGCKSVQLEVGAKNTRAINFYTGFGFVEKNVKEGNIVMSLEFLGVN